ncbi:hypothetical protein A2853_01215 [Candidatus Kaiserbacteria bacterium RIFCSPHIGHO2_01_FULL_55_17]|uniref:Uncharacterized protein n=1 Tax=Candidatus Kaiserbacteria bacterium RIFCSPHIGHO2_01_FULL_55_17 TaxID=1798484 RepID=A0A1F6D9K7_9BACT|nr:MAG: hypothetical protein A2853_01215 [Candidatus Kaiserbacteria bacterium RIFCSPHIGHO2_01_FULL_55_17]
MLKRRKPLKVTSKRCFETCSFRKEIEQRKSEEEARKQYIEDRRPKAGEAVRCHLRSDTMPPKVGTCIIVGVMEWLSFPFSSHWESGIKFPAIVTSEPAEMEFETKSGRRSWKGQGILVIPKTSPVPSEVDHFFYDENLSALFR